MRTYINLTTFTALLLFSTLNSFGFNWTDMGNKQLELAYYEVNGARYSAPGETMYIDNFSSNNRTEYNWYYPITGGQNIGTAIANGNDLKLIASNGDVNVLHFVSSDGNMLYTNDSYGVMRAFRVRGIINWENLNQRVLRLDYWYRNGQKGVVPGETFRIKCIPPEGIFNCIFDWVGVNAHGAGNITKRVGIFRKIEAQEVFTFKIIGFDSANNRLYTIDNTDLVRVFAL